MRIYYPHPHPRPPPSTHWFLPHILLLLAPLNSNSNFKCMGKQLQRAMKIISTLQEYWLTSFPGLPCLHAILNKHWRWERFRNEANTVCTTNCNGASKYAYHYWAYSLLNKWAIWSFVMSAHNQLDPPCAHFEISNSPISSMIKATQRNS